MKVLLENVPLKNAVSSDMILL